ncbi:hypothetical protein PF003_g30979 [Phytophthora fragariae]|nr:hypothetical protein PF003_g30979 [Phytophthora fragariae]
MVVAFATPKALTEPHRRGGDLRRCCSSRTALWRCWPRCSWRRLRRCGRKYDDFEAVLASMVVALATPKTLTEPTDVAVTAPMWE